METFFLASTAGYIDKISKNPRRNWVSSNVPCIRVWVLNDVPKGKIEAEFDQNVKLPFWGECDFTRIGPEKY